VTEIIIISTFQGQKVSELCCIMSSGKYALYIQDDDRGEIETWVYNVLLSFMNDTLNEYNKKSTFNGTQCEKCAKNLRKSI
jgi:hypothetical protein